MSSEAVHAEYLPMLEVDACLRHLLLPVFPDPAPKYDQQLKLKLERLTSKARIISMAESSPTYAIADGP